MSFAPPVPSFGKVIGTRGWHCHATDITRLLHATTRQAITSPKPDAILNIESHFFDVTLVADRCNFELDLGRDLWLNRQRWSRLIREYVPRDGLDRFIGQALEIRAGQARDGATANLMFRDPDRYDKKHRWGGCLMGATFRGDGRKHPSVLTFYSRTTYMGYMGLLDAAIASVIAQQIEEDGQNPEAISFVWHISSMQLHCFKTLPFMFSQPDMMGRLERIGRNPRAVDQVQWPTLRNIGKWYLKILASWLEHGPAMLDHEKYGPFKRIKRRWMEHQGHSTKNLPPSCPVTSLNFDKAE